MSPPGRPKGEYRSAQREGAPVNVSHANLQSLRGRTAIVGAATFGCGECPGHTDMEMLAKAAHAAVADAGLTMADIDGLATASVSAVMWPLGVVEYLGLNPRYIDGTMLGGSSFVAHLLPAMQALHFGQCNAVLVCYGSAQKSSTFGRKEIVGLRPFLDPQPYEHPYQPQLPVSAYALAASRHMHEFGTTREQLADVAVAARAWARLNPEAYLREPLTRADVLASRMVSDPLTVRDCCPVTDGAGAFVLVRAERARDLPHKPVYVLGNATAVWNRQVSSMPDLTVTAAQQSGAEAFVMAGLTPRDIDIVELYDAFTINTILFLEDLGFCAKGEGGAFVADGAIAPGGRLPVNTNGGGLSCVHPGMYGVFTVIEAVRQLRGEAGERQVAGAATALAHGNGGMLSSQSTAVLARPTRFERPPMIRDTDTLNALLDAVNRFVRDELVPAEALVAETDEIPERIVRGMKELGLFGLTVPEEYGGLGVTMEEEVMVMLAMGQTSPAFRWLFGTTVGIGSQGILIDGTEAQKQTYLPRLATGELIASFALTEPEAGSDAASLRTSAVLDGDHYVINGTKRYITNAPHAGLFTLMARTNPADKGAGGVSAFIVEADTPGISIGPRDKKMGQRGAHTADVIFENCRVPAGQIIGGREGQGFKTAMKVLEKGRIHIAAICVGVAERMQRDALNYALQRRQFGQPIAEFQLVQAMLADSQTEIYAARCMVIDAARRRDEGRNVALEASCCKLFASEMCGRVADRAVQVFGGAGYIADAGIERFYRDVRLFRLYEGTSQIQQIVIARQLVKEATR